jgi:hypothetical protein
VGPGQLQHRVGCPGTAGHLGKMQVLVPRELGWTAILHFRQSPRYAAAPCMELCTGVCRKGHQAQNGQTCLEGQVGRLPPLWDPAEKPCLSFPSWMVGSDTPTSWNYREGCE